MLRIFSSSSHRLITCMVGLCLCVGMASCGKDGVAAPAAAVEDGKDKASSTPPKTTDEEIPNVVTPEIQAGIEKHVEDQAKKGGGYYKFTAKGKEYSFKLVRVHTEYLARLEPGKYFACVDLVDTKGDVYDADFLMEGTLDDMRVTEATLHKLNGIPFYAWEQADDDTWKRVPAETASQELLGVLTGKDAFEFRYTAKLPAIATSARMWLPKATSDQFQTVTVTSATIPGKHRVIEDKAYGNKIYFVELGPEDGGKPLEIRYQVERVEKAAFPGDAEKAKAHLAPERLVPAKDSFKAIANEVIQGKKTDLVRARAIYDHTIDRMQYIKHGKGWGQGDAQHACDAKFGNCTDFHSYFIAVARAAGIPARFSIGAGIPSSRNDGGVDGYHCWAEFFADGKWWPVDISEADKYTSLATYYFGHHPANRLEFSQGRDLVVDPGPASGPINFLAYPVFEMDGQLIKIPVKFYFDRPSKN